MNKRSLMMLATASCLLVSCSLQQHIAGVMSKVEKQYSQVKEWNELPLRTITWNQALDIMLRQNAEIINAQRSIEKAERETLRLYTDLIPTVTYYGYVNKSLRDLSTQWRDDDLTQNINVNFSIPTLTQVPYRVYASRATAYSAVKAKEGKERELTSKLYVLLRKRELEQRRQNQLSRQAPSERPESPLPQTPEMQEEKHWAETAKLLGDYSARWNILPESMPRVRWTQYRNKTDKLDPLIICQYALQLERAKMAQYGVALNYLPTINTSLYSPSLFSSTGGTYSGTFLDSRDTKLNLSLSYSLDTRMQQWERYKDNQAAYERAQSEVRAGLMEHRTKLAALRRSMDDYEAWQSYMHKRRDYLLNTPHETATAFLECQKALQDLDRELLDQETAGIETEGALILEYGLPNDKQ